MSATTAPTTGARADHGPGSYAAAVVREFDAPLIIEEVPSRRWRPTRSGSRSKRPVSATPTSTPPTATGRSSRPRRSSRGTRASAMSWSSAPA